MLNPPFQMGRARCKGTKHTSMNGGFSVLHISSSLNDLLGSAGISKSSIKSMIVLKLWMLERN